MLLRHLHTLLTEGTGLDMFFRFRTAVYFVLVLGYTLLPVDLIPEAVLGFVGLLDDVFFALMALVALSSAFRERLRQGGFTT